MTTNRGRAFWLVIASLVIVGAGGAAIFLHLDNARLKSRVAEAQREQARVLHLNEETQRTRAVLAAAATGEVAAEQVMRTEVQRLRAEVADLEHRAEVQRAQLAGKDKADGDALAHNRDPEAGLVRLEHFQDRGLSTPSLTLQTLVRAALKGDEARLVELVFISSEARAKADELIAGLPVEERGRWSAEKLAALSFSGIITEATAMEIVKIDQPETGRAIATLRVPGAKGEPKLPLQFGPKGWQVLVTGGQIEALRKRLRAGPAP